MWGLSFIICGGRVGTWLVGNTKRLGPLHKRTSSPHCTMSNAGDRGHHSGSVAGGHSWCWSSSLSEARAHRGMFHMPGLKM
jgi:hypothetical protein